MCFTPAARTAASISRASAKFIANGFAKRAANRCHFEAMGKPVVYKYRAGQRKYLRFVLQPAES
jgi:hypothetical protein